MKWCRYQSENGPTFGVIDGDEVSEVRGSPFGEHEITSTTHKLADVKLLVPVVPGTFYAGGMNYEYHIIEGCKKYGVEPKIPTEVVITYRSNNALIAHDETIVRPDDSTGDFQYEGELVAVIGKTCKNVSREEAMDCIFGWTIGNDVSERAWQLKDPSFLRSKNSDTFKPMGPWIVTDFDVDSAVTTVKLNGRVADTFKTGNMLFDVPTHIVEISKYCTLYPGDVIWFGTDGVPENMSDGDVVEIEISGIGTLRNKVSSKI